MGHEKLSKVVAEAARVLRQLDNEKSKLASRVTDLERRLEAVAIVGRMEELGKSDVSVPLEERVNAILDSGKDLSLIKEAMELSTADLSFATVADNVGVGSKVDKLEDFILNG